MRSILDLVWEVLPNVRRTKCRNASVWIQLPVPDKTSENKITNFMSLVNELVFEEEWYEVRVRFARRHDAIHEVLFAIIQVKLS